MIVRCSIVLMGVIFVLACATTAPTLAPDNALPAAPAAVVAATATLGHQSVPGEPPAEGVYRSGDQDSSPFADKKAAPGGDRFTFGRFERPFNADTMDTYFPDLDIQETWLIEDATWIYAALTLKSADANGQLHGKYGFEIDSNVDGGGDWLVMVAQPASQEWSVDGVQILFDANDDVGGVPTINADDPSSNGNGYETALFNSGVGDDPDLGWARVFLQEPVTVQFSVKKSLLAGDDKYMVGMWSGTEDFDPSLFDLNDHYTHEQAGAALRDFEYFYPIKALSELDNACRISIGYQPVGNEPGSCPIYVPNEPGEAPSCKQTVCYNLGATRVCYCVQY